MKKTKTVNKNALIIEYLQGNISFGELGKKHGVCKATAHVWVTKYLAQSQQLNVQSPDIVTENTSHFGKMSGLEQELYQARSELKLLREIIDIAEKELGVNIRKKSGAEQ